MVEVFPKRLDVHQNIRHCHLVFILNDINCMELWFKKDKSRQHWSVASNTWEPQKCYIRRGNRLSDIFLYSLTGCHDKNRIHFYSPCSHFALYSSTSSAVMQSTSWWSSSSISNPTESQVPKYQMAASSPSLSGSKVEHGPTASEHHQRKQKSNNEKMEKRIP